MPQLWKAGEAGCGCALHTRTLRSYPVSIARSLHAVHANIHVRMRMISMPMGQACQPQAQAYTKARAHAYRTT